LNSQTLGSIASLLTISPPRWLHILYTYLCIFGLHVLT
jgi:hypothetical protein